MKNQMVFAIKDQDGNYVTPHVFTLTDQGWLYSVLTGITSGLTCYAKECRVKEELVKAREVNNRYGFNKKFHIEYIDLKTVRKGEMIFNELSEVLVS